MNQENLNLLHRYLDGAITPKELGPLEQLLRESAQARATLRSLATIDAKWQQLAADETVARHQRIALVSVLAGPVGRAGQRALAAQLDDVAAGRQACVRVSAAVVPRQDCGLLAI